MAETHIQTLAWDSEFFNLKVGEIHVDSDNDTMDPDDDDFDLIYAKDTLDFKIEIKGYDQRFSEAKVVFGKKLTSVENRKSDSIFIDKEVSFSLDQIYKLAFESGKYSRFKLDHNFNPASFQNLYKIWVDNSLNRKFADAVLLYIEGENVLGFVTYKKQQDFATIGLIAVAPEAQGKGIGSQLISETERILILSGTNNLRIPTQLSNEAACLFYKKQGYDIAETAYIKHYWKSK